MAAHVLRAERGPPRRPLTRAATCPYAHAQAHCPYPCISPENNTSGSLFHHGWLFGWKWAHISMHKPVIAHMLKLYSF